MNGTLRCDRFVDAILDETAPRPAGLEEHLASCPACRTLAAAHRAAQDLPPSRLVPPVPVGGDEIRARVRRRRTVRTVGAGVLAVAIAAVLLAGPLRRGEQAAPPGDLFALADGLRDLTRRDPLAGDPAIGAMGPVSDWLAPPRASRFDLDSILPSLGLRATGGGDAP
jgi:anti-sigma factor RsiW